MERRNWTWEETLMAFVLYYTLPEKEIDDKSPKIAEFAKAIGRSANAAALKAWNIAANDPNRIASGRVGMPHGSKLDAEVWKRLEIEGDDLVEEGIKLLEATCIENKSPNITRGFIAFPNDETERVVTRTERVNQDYFRNSLLRNYSGQCALTGIAIPKLLTASHIKPWKDCATREERLTARNGILLNALHDRAFDRGLMTINTDYEIVLSSTIKHDDPNQTFLFKYEGKRLNVPLDMPPAKEFIEYHNDVVFIA